MIATATILENGLFDDIRVPEGARLPPLHITWHVAAAYDWAEAADVLDGIAAECEPFEARVLRAHVFATDRFAVVGLLREDPALREMHDRIVGALAPYAHHVDERYATAQWLPHVTFASGVSEEQARDVTAALDSTGAHELTVDNVAFLSVEFGRFILSHVQRFKRTGRINRTYE